MTMEGTMIGAISSRKTTPVQRLALRAMAKAARVATASVTQAVARPMPKERMVADTQTGDAKYSANQRRPKPGGGKERNCELVKAMGTSARMGATSRATSAQ